MTVIISRSKKHVYLGRMLTTTSTKIQLLIDIKKRVDSLLLGFSHLDNLYTDCESMDFPTEELGKLADDKLSLKKMAGASALITQAVAKELQQAIFDLDTYERELDRAEKVYQKTIEKEKKKTKPLSPANKDKQEMLEAVNLAANQAEKEKL